MLFIKQALIHEYLKIFLLIASLSIFSTISPSMFTEYGKGHEHCTAKKTSIHRFMQNQKNSIAILLLTIAKIFSYLIPWKQNCFSVLPYFYRKEVMEGKNYLGKLPHLYKKQDKMVPVMRKNLIGSFCSVKLYNNHYDRLVLTYRAVVIGSLYDHMRKIRFSKNNKLLLPILKFFSIARLTRNQTKYIYLEYLPEFFTAPDEGNLYWLIDYYKKKIQNKSEEIYDWIKKIFLDKNVSGAVLKILFHFYRYQPDIQQFLMRECFLLRKYNINFTYEYNNSVHEKENIPLCGAHSTTILTFLLLEMKQAIKKNDMEYVSQLSLLFKFLVVECKAHLFMHDDNHQVPIMMIEEDKKLKQIIEKNFEQKGFQEIIKEQLSNNFCPCAWINSYHRCTHPLFDAIAHYDIHCLRYILRKDCVASYVYHHYDFSSSSNESITINHDSAYHMSSFEIALSFHTRKISSVIDLFSHDKNVKITHKDSDVSPYLSVLQMLLEEEKKGKDTGLNKVNLWDIIQCFDYPHISMDETYKIFVQIIGSNKLPNYSISNIGFDKQGIAKQEKIEKQKMFQMLQPLKTLPQDIFHLIVSYCINSGYVYINLSFSLAKLWDKQELDGIISSGVTSKNMVNFKGFTPERNILIEYYVASNKLEDKDYVSDHARTSLELQKKNAVKGYYQLLTILGYDKDESGYSNTFDDHYALFLETLNPQ